MNEEATMTTEMPAAETPVITEDEFGETSIGEGEGYLISIDDEPDPLQGLGEEKPDEEATSLDAGTSVIDAVAEAEVPNTEAVADAPSADLAQKAQAFDDLMSRLSSNPVDMLKHLLAQMPQSVQKVFAEEMTGTAKSLQSAKEKVDSLGLDWESEDAIITPADRFVHALKDDFVTTLDNVGKIYSWTDEAAKYINQQAEALSAQSAESAKMAQTIAALEAKVAALEKQTTVIGKKQAQPAGLVSQGGSAPLENKIDWSKPGALEKALHMAHRMSQQQRRK